MYYLGFDIGGSSVKAVLVKDKQIIKSQMENLPDKLEGLLELILKMKNKLTEGIEAEEIKGVGFALAGAIDVAREEMLKSTNISYLDNQPIKKLLEQKLKPYQVKIENDANCFLLAEKEVGLAKNLKNVFYLTLGTGIGGAWMFEGKMALGAHGAAGEAGHMIIEASQGLDLEELASNKFIKRLLGLGSVEANQKAQAGDRAALQAFQELGKNLGVGLANIINIFDPEAIILGGGIAETKEFILPGARERIERYVTSPAAKETEILFSQLGREGGALGAALLFQKR